jgi:Zn-dependent M28 family amino/carboxypeptidase
LITILPSAALLEALFEGEHRTGAQIMQASASDAPDAAARGFALSPAKRLGLSVALRTTTATTQNVVAVVEGADPKLRDEYVAVGSHYDHVGVGRPVGGDSIYNGADDDGSGTVAMMAMAEAFARGPRPRRSILFVWHAGEEHGLWGSDYFARYPTVPLDRVVTQLNMDMIGRSKRAGDAAPANRDLSGPDEIYVIGSKMMSTELGHLSERVNRAYLNLSFNYKYDDPRDPNRFFFRSDHYNYARRGVPVIFYFDGVHEDYHRPSDTPDKIDYRKLERVARTVFVTAAEIANLPARPRVDKQLPSELTGR